MTTTIPTKDSYFLNDFSEKNIFFLAPAYFDFSNTSNYNCIRLLNTLIRNFAVKEVKEIIGSSTSAIITLLLGMGYTTNEIQSRINKVVFHQSFKAKKLTPLSVEVKDKTQDFRFKGRKKEFTCLHEDSFLVWAKQQISEKLENPLATFADLYSQTKITHLLKNIHLLVLNLTTSKLVLLNYKNTPDMPIAIAARICMSFSTAFSVVEIKDVSANVKCIYTDGGITLQHFNFDRIAS